MSDTVDTLKGFDVVTFWIRIDIADEAVTVSMHDLDVNGNPHCVILTRTGTTILQALRAMADALIHVHVKPERIGSPK